MIVYHIFTFLPMLVALFWVLILLLEPRKDLSKRYLAFFLSLSAINYAIHGLFFNHEYGLYVIFDSLWVLTSLLGYPLYYYYIRLLTKDKTIELRWFWISLPSFIVSLLSLFVYLMMTPAELDIFIHGVMYKEIEITSIDSIWVKLQIFRLNLFKIIFAIQLILAVYWGFQLIKEYNRSLRKFYSNVGGKDLTFIKGLLISFLFASTVSLISNIIGKDYFIGRTELLALVSITHSTFLFVIGFYGYKQNFSIREYVIDIKMADKDACKLVTLAEQPDKNIALFEKLCHLMSDNQLFKNKDLRISDVCTLLGSNRTYVSQIINSHANTNFCDFVNKYRVEYAESLLIANTNLSLEDIGILSGFSGKSTFYRTFREKKGISPGQFRKRVNHTDFNVV